MGSDGRPPGGRSRHEDPAYPGTARGLPGGGDAALAGIVHGCEDPVDPDGERARRTDFGTQIGAEPAVFGRPYQPFAGTPRALPRYVIGTR